MLSNIASFSNMSRLRCHIYVVVNIWYQIITTPWTRQINDNFLLRNTFKNNLFFSNLSCLLTTPKTPYTLDFTHGPRTPREEIAFTAQSKIHSHSQFFRYGRSIFCLPHRPNFSDIFDLCLHWVSIVCHFTIAKKYVLSVQYHISLKNVIFELTL